MTRLEVWKGRHIDYTLTLKDQDAVVVNISSSTIKFMVKKNITDLDADAVITKTSAGGTEITIDDGPRGICTVYLTPVDTRSLTSGDYYWDVYAKLLSNKEYSSEPDEFEVKEVVRKT